MKTFLTLFIYFHSFLLFSQPTLNGPNSNPLIGDVFHSIIFDVANSPGNAGANQTWDFSSFTSNLTSKDSVVPLASTHDPLDFPLADYGIFAGNSYFIYNANSNDSLTNYGSSSGSWIRKYVDPEIILTYPFTFNSFFSDQFHGTANNSGTNYSIDGTVSVLADAYGTLQLPFGTYNNILRIKKELTEVDSVNGVPTIIHSFTYSWYLPGIHLPILVLTENSGSGSYNVKYLTQQTISVLQINNVASTVFPNPCINNLTIQTSSPINEANLVIYDSHYKKVMEVVGISTDRMVILTSELKEGGYFYSILRDMEILSSGRFIKVE